MEMLCPQCLSPLVSADGVTAICPAHGGSYRVLFARAAFPAPPEAPADIPEPPQAIGEIQSAITEAATVEAPVEPIDAMDVSIAEPALAANALEVEPDWESVEIPANDAHQAAAEPPPQASQTAAPAPPTLEIAPATDASEEQEDLKSPDELIAQPAAPAASELPADELLAAFDEPDLAVEELAPGDSAVEAMESLAHSPPAVQPPQIEPEESRADAIAHEPVEQKAAAPERDEIPEALTIAEHPAPPAEPIVPQAPPPIPVAPPILPPPPIPAAPPRPALLDAPLPPAPHRGRPGHPEQRKPGGAGHAPAHAHLPPAPPPPADEAADAFHGLPPTARPLPASVFGPGIELPTPAPLSPAASRTKERVVPKPPPPAMAPPPPPGASSRESSPRKSVPSTPPPAGPIHLPLPPDAHLPHQPPAPIATASAARPLPRRASRTFSPVRKKMAIAGLALAALSALGLSLVATGVTAATSAPENLVLIMSVVCLFAPWLGLALGAFAYRIAVPNPKLVWASILANCVLIFAWIFVFVLKHSAG
jgi:hypothetical protein